MFHLIVFSSLRDLCFCFVPLPVQYSSTRFAPPLVRDLPPAAEQYRVFFLVTLTMRYKIYETDFPNFRTPPQFETY